MFSTDRRSASMTTASASPHPLARPTKQFRCYRVPLLQHRLQDRALIGSVGDDMNEHGGLIYRPFGKTLFGLLLKS